LLETFIVAMKTTWNNFYEVTKNLPKHTDNLFLSR
jgi:hypothetical protein